MIQEFGLYRVEKNYYSVFWIQDWKRIMLVVYVDYIVIIRNDTGDWQHKELCAEALSDQEFWISEVLFRHWDGQVQEGHFFLSQRKYILNLLSENGMIECKNINSSMDVNTKLLLNQGASWGCWEVHEIGEKIKLPTVTRSDITFTVSVVSQFLSAPRTTHLEALMKILRYLKKAPGRWHLYSDNR